MTDVKGNDSGNSSGNKMLRPGRRNGMRVLWKYLLMVILCLTANAGAACAQTVAESELGTDDFLYITKMLEPMQAGNPDRPEEVYWDRNGNQYELERYEIKEIPGHRVNRDMEKQMVYKGVEGAEEIPQSIGIQEEVSGEDAEGRLVLRDSRIVREEWQDGFQALVLFHSYGAEEYQVGSVIIEGSDVLSASLDAQEEILGVMGLRPWEYRILSMEWAGEPFENDQGQMCRQAMAIGQKLVRDYEVTYEGAISFMAPPSHELEMVYRPVPLSQIWVDKETENEHGIDSHAAASTVPRERTPWYWVRTGVVITVGAGLIGIGVGILILVSGWIRQRRREKQKRCLPEIRG